jgi:hypothetical protein
MLMEKAASECDAKTSRVRARLYSLSRMERPAVNTLLTVAEEAGFVLWLDYSMALRLRSSKQMLENECNYILA